jgi:hypothetical protein
MELQSCGWPLEKFFQVVAAWRYLENNAEEMEHPRSCRLGSPTTSSLVSSLVGRCNARVKSKQKYQNRLKGAEVILYRPQHLVT